MLFCWCKVEGEQEAENKEGVPVYERRWTVLFFLDWGKETSICHEAKSRYQKPRGADAITLM